MLKFNRNFYLQKQIKWGKKNLDNSIFFLSFDFETQKDIDIIEVLTKKLINSKIFPYYAVPGELINNNKEIFKRISNSCIIINHGYRIHTAFDSKKKQNYSNLSYNDLTNSEIINDINNAHKIIKKICNQDPKIFRAPHFGEYAEKSSLEFIYKTLVKLNYVYSSSTPPIFSLINSPISKHFNIYEMSSSSYIKMPLQIIDSWSINNSKLNYKYLYKEFRQVYKLMKSSKLFFNIYFDPSDVIKKKTFFDNLKNFSKFQKRIENMRII